MSTMEWMKSKANKTVVVEQYDGVEFEVETLFFMGRLPYRMMKDVNKGYFNQTKSGSVASGDYVEIAESMHRYGDKDPRAVYSYTVHTQKGR